MQHVTREKIVEHIEVHMTHPTVVMTNVVRDLLQIAKTAKASSTIRCEENHIEMIDSKAVNLYLKTIGELQSALRHDALRPGVQVINLPRGFFENIQILYSHELAAAIRLWIPGYLL